MVGVGVAGSVDAAVTGAVTDVPAFGTVLSPDLQAVNNARRDSSANKL